LFTNSTYCFKKLLAEKSWTKARVECERDEGDLATFGSSNEMLYFSSPEYLDFRFGYRKPWKPKNVRNSTGVSLGKNSSIVFYSVMH
jgi:hypothetical protein